MAIFGLFLKSIFLVAIMVAVFIIGVVIYLYLRVRRVARTFTSARQGASGPRASSSGGRASSFWGIFKAFVSLFCFVKWQWLVCKRGTLRPAYRQRDKQKDILKGRGRICGI